MNLGKNIFDLRKKKNVTQEELAAQLGVTAAAVSKWENGYTLPDVLMLCAIADYFDVTTDALLGREKSKKFAVIAAETMARGQKVAEFAAANGIITHGIYTDFQEAVTAARSHSEVNCLLACFRRELTGEERKSVTDPIRLVESVSDSDEMVLDGFKLAFRYLLADTTA